MRQALVFLVLASAIAVAQIPHATLLPVQLKSSIESNRNKAGDRIAAQLMQDLHFQDGEKVNAGARLTGTITAIKPGTITFEFKELHSEHQVYTLLTDLRAIASPTEVYDAELPTNAAGGDRGSSIADWNTIQVGGEAVYGRGGPVMEGSHVVGHSLMSGGVVGLPQSMPESKCRGDLGNSAPQSFWIFATSACGVYGFDGLFIQHAGRNQPLGSIRLSSSAPIRLRAGTGLLLRVVHP